MENRNHWEILDEGMITVHNNPQELWNNARNYFKWCTLNPIIIQRAITQGKAQGTTFADRKIRPFNLHSLCLHLGVTPEYIKDIKQNGTGEYKTVVDNILLCIYVQLWELGAIGELNAGFVMKTLNMDKEDDSPQRITIEYIGNLPALAESENEILEKLNLEKPDLGIVN